MRQEARRALILVALAACGGPSRPAPTPPPPPPPPDPAMAEVLVQLRAQRERMCACTDAACVEEAEVAQFEWAIAHRELLNRARATEEQEDEADTLTHNTENCAERYER